MRIALLLVALAASVTLFVGFSATPALPEAPVGDTAAPPFAVVELFTSEGCSSCPPADANLDALAARAEKDGKAVYALAFHVDYWDRLGWKDPFADARYSARQGAYVKALGRRQLYTPQMVVNGRAELVGSSKSKARAAVESALSEAATVKVEANAHREGQTWTVEYLVEGAPKGMHLAIAITEGGHAVSVTRGENSGETLRHEHPVRAFTSAPLKGAKGILTLKAAVDPKRAQVIVFVQDPASMAILGATRAR